MSVMRCNSRLKQLLSGKSVREYIYRIKINQIEEYYAKVYAWNDKNKCCFVIKRCYQKRYLLILWIRIRTFYKPIISKITIYIIDPWCLFPTKALSKLSHFCPNIQNLSPKTKQQSYAPWTLIRLCNDEQIMRIRRKKGSTIQSTITTL